MNERPLGATIVEAERASVMLATDGRCITNTLQALEDGAGSGKPMARAAIEKTRIQAVDLLREVLLTYSDDVALGEVGLNGSARASASSPRAGRCPTGLLYGRIQSGKTVAMITFAALAIDNGFRVVVVLTSDNLKLVEQTATRFSALDGIVLNSTQIGNWDAETGHVRKNLPHVGLVLVCAKNQRHLANLVEFLKKIGAPEYPAIILDDEADQATPDTTLNARTSGRANAPKDPSAINDLTMLQVREVLRHNIFVQVTATPYALLLQNTDSPLRPQFTKILEPGQGYTGGEHFFAQEHIDEMMPPVVFVSDTESDDLERGVDVAPAGLIQGLAFFLVAAGAQAVGDNLVRARGQNFLCHTSQKRVEHDKVSNLIRDYIDQVGDQLRRPSVSGAVAIHLEVAHQELRRTIAEPPSLAEILADLRQRLPKRQVVVVNSDGNNAEFTRGLNFIVGGNILGRGLTIENLLVSYYLRRAKVSQMDTMLQHARMFGYRGSVMPFTRVFLPERLALRFHRIHTAEQNLRQLLSDPERRARIPVQVSEGLRATRPGVLDTGSILAYTPGHHLYPGKPLTTKDADKAHDRARDETVKLGGYFRERRTPTELVPISIEDACKLISLLPYDESDEDTWDPKAIRSLLVSNHVRFEGRMFLNCRKMERESFTQGAVSGDDLKSLRLKNRPVLCVFLDTGHKYGKKRGYAYPHDFIYPSLILPEDDEMPVHVFNVSE